SRGRFVHASAASRDLDAFPARRSSDLRLDGGCPRSVGRKTDLAPFGSGMWSGNAAEANLKMGHSRAAIRQKVGVAALQHRQQGGRDAECRTRLGTRGWHAYIALRRAPNHRRREPQNEPIVIFLPKEITESERS